MTDGKGKTQGTTRDHLAGMVKRGQERFRAQLEGPGLPDDLRVVWGIYVEVSEGRTTGGMTASALTWSDVLAWQSVTGVTLSAWEVETLFKMDGAVRAGADGKA